MSDGSERWECVLKATNARRMVSNVLEGLKKETYARKNEFHRYMRYTTNGSNRIVPFLDLRYDLLTILTGSPDG